jgi:membrane protease YdiL (CAAX protease family)
MFTKLASLPKAWIYTLIVMLLGTLFALIPGISSSAYMLTPTISVLLMLFIVTRDGYTKAGLKQLGLHTLGIKTWPFALLVPLVLQLIGYSVLWLTGLGSITYANLEGYSPSVVLIATIPTLIMHTLTSALTEEIGWRGYLLPQLMDLGPQRAFLLNGFIHACWHLPMILLTSSYHAEGPRWVVIPLFLATVTIIGVVFGYLRLVTNSVWPAALIHGAHNVFWGRFALFTQSDSQWSEVLTGDTGILQLVLYTLVAFYLFKKLPSLTNTQQGKQSNG